MNLLFKTTKEGRKGGRAGRLLCRAAFGGLLLKSLHAVTLDFYNSASAVALAGWPLVRGGVGQVPGGAVCI